MKRAPPSRHGEGGARAALQAFYCSATKVRPATATSMSLVCDVMQVPPVVIAAPLSEMTSLERRAVVPAAHTTPVPLWVETLPSIVTTTPPLKAEKPAKPLPAATLWLTVTLELP